MKNVLVLISSAGHPALNDGAIRCAVDVCAPRAPRWARPTGWQPDIACDIPFDGPPTGVAMTALDGIVVPVEGRRKKLLVADMESTVIENEMLDELADFLGLREKIAGITARAMNGEIDFAGALAERVGLLKGLPVARLDEAARRIRYTPGGATLVATMKKHGAYCALVSGGFTHFTALVKQALGFNSDAANILKHDGHTLLGTVEPPILGKEAKLATLERLAVEHGLSAGRLADRGRWRQRPADAGGGRPGRRFPRQARRCRPGAVAHRSRRSHGAALPAGLSPHRLRRKERPMTDALQIVLARRPAGDVTPDCFRQESVSLPAPGEGQVLVRSRFLSLDPYMRPRMTELRSYTPPFELDKPLTGGSVGEVVEVEEFALRQGRHRDRPAELGDPYAP